MSGGDWAATVTAARAALAQYRLATQAEAVLSGPAMEWPAWAGRLATHLGALLDAPAARCLDRVCLDAAQLDVVLDALDEAADYRQDCGGRECADCDTGPAALCEDHAGDLDRAAQYAAVARQLRQEAGR